MLGNSSVSLLGMFAECARHIPSGVYPDLQVNHPSHLVLSNLSILKIGIRTARMKFRRQPSNQSLYRDRLGSAPRTLPGGCDNVNQLRYCPPPIPPSSVGRCPAQQAQQEGNMAPRRGPRNPPPKSLREQFLTVGAGTDVT